MFDTSSEIQQVLTPFIANSGVKLFMQRDDKIHPFVSGNKWYKLKYNIVKFRESEMSNIVTFGGAYSNHLIATAAASAACGINCIGVVRGEELNANSNFVMRLCKEFGMDLHFVSRAAYNNHDDLARKYNLKGSFVIPEGGDNDAGRRGCEEIVNDFQPYDGVVVPVGTSTTFSGIINASHNKSYIHGIAAVGEASYLNPHIAHNTLFDNWKLHTSFSFGGFGKYDNDQVEFNKKFASETGILLDPIYTGKMMRGIYSLIEQGVFAPNEKVLCIHTGGLTGLLSEQWRMS